MSLTLTIENIERLDNDEPTQLKLDRHGAVIGRSPHADWSLPDTKNYISSTHCEIDYRDGAYLLIDKSTNGTLLNDATQRIDGPQALKDGDVVIIGQYRIAVRTKDGPQAAAPAPSASKSGWGGWDDLPGTPAAPPASSGWDNPSPAQAAPGWGAAAPAPSGSGWDAAPSPAPSSWNSAPAPAGASSGWGDPAAAAPASSGWDSPSPAAPAAGSGWNSAPGAAPVDTDPWGAVSPTGPAKSGWDPLSTGSGAPAPGGWDSAPAAAVSGRGPMAQNWSAPRTEPTAPEPAAEAVDDVWGRFAASNAVDWTRGGFADPEPVATPPQSSAPHPAVAPQAVPAAVQSDAVWAAFVSASGVTPAALKAQPVEAATVAGALLKRLVAGLVVMMEARARAKAQLGAQSTTLELGGNNPLKFARSPEKVLAQLLSPPERGFMDAERAIEDSFQDLQAHQMATLAAMQGALRSTLDRFSPEAIRSRAETRGLLARILPSARNAALWDAYQREFEGVARGSDEAFLDVFAKAFKAAYEQAAADMKREGR